MNKDKFYTETRMQHLDMVADAAKDFVRLESKLGEILHNNDYQNDEVDRAVEQLKYSFATLLQATDEFLLINKIRR